MFNLFNFFTTHLLFIFKIAIAGTILIITRTIALNISPTLHQFLLKNHFDNNTAHIITKIIRYVISAIGITIALQNVGLEVSMLIAAFGITGIVLSYGMKDIVANFIASILIMGYQQIKINDYIKIKDWQGKVIDINLRYTTLQNGNETIFVPNIILYTQTVCIIKQ